jgi:hypothetical protein
MFIRGVEIWITPLFDLPADYNWIFREKLLGNLCVNRCISFNERGLMQAEARPQEQAKDIEQVVHIVVNQLRGRGTT